MLLRKLHRWLGLLLCLSVLVMSVTGVLLVWKPEYQRFTVPGANDALINDSASVARVIDTIVTESSAKSVLLINTHPDGLALYKVRFVDKRYAWYNQQAELVEVWSSNGRFEDWLLDLHHRFLLGNTIGLNIAGFSGILLVPLVLVGLFLWWRVRNAGRFKVWPEGSRPGQLLRSHRNLGVASSAVIIFVAISGVILVYPVESAWVLLGDISKQAKPHVQSIENGSDLPSTQEKLDYAYSLYPRARLRIVRPPNQYSDEFLVGVQQDNGLNRLGKTHISFANHKPVSTSNALEQPRSKRLFDFVFPLHTGQLPLWYRLLLTAFGLVLTLVTSLGLIAYTKRRMKHSSRA